MSGSYDLGAGSEKQDPGIRTDSILKRTFSTVNPSLIVLGGKIPDLGEYFLNEVREDLKKTGFRRMVDNVTVRYSQLQSDSFLNGAMKYFFDIHYSFTNQDPTNFFIG